MKVVFPKNIQKGIIAGMTFNIGPLTLSIIQLFIVAGGLWAGVGIFNAVMKSGWKALGVIAALPVVWIFMAIAFFKISELSLLAFIAKKVRNNFFDTTKKYQVNYEKINPFQVLLKSISIDNSKKRSFEQKEQTNVGGDLLDRIEGGGLL